MNSATLEQQVQSFAETFRRVKAQIGRIIVGNSEIVDGVLTALFAGGHVLLEGLPGLGKTRLVNAVAETLDLQFRRIQFTPDLMPADIVGTTILSEDEHGRRQFVFQKGPVFGNLILTDEINRATPKTQAALLEAMQEGCVTIAGETHRLPQPFLVLATQNPIELEGTYPLPEAQLDRFMLKLLLPRAEVKDLVQILERTTGGEQVKLEQSVSLESLLQFKELVTHVPAAEPVKEYVARLVLSTHPDHELATPKVKRFVRFGSSPRGAQALLRCAKVLALAEQRFNVALNDIRKMAQAVLRHRILLNYEGEAEGIGSDALIAELLKEVKAG